MSDATSGGVFTNGQIITMHGKSWRDAYMRLDGNGITQFMINGGGTVNCQFYDQPTIKTRGVLSYEKYRAHTTDDGLVAFESVAFPKCYLRLDGRGVSAQNKAGKKANLQFYADPPTSTDLWEVFRATVVANGEITIESAHFSGVYLRINGQGVTSFNTAGSGSVDCYWGVEDQTTLEALIQTV